MHHHCLVIALASCAFVGCSSAEIARRSGPVTVGEITGGDRENLHVREASGFKDTVIPRQDILDIQHPGTPMNMIGWMIISIYGPVMVSGVALALQGNENLGVPFAFAGGMMSGVGGAFVLYGWYQASASRARAEEGWAPPASSAITPVMMRGRDGRARVGLGVTGRF